MAEITRGTLKGRVTPKAFLVEEKDPEVAALYAEYFAWLNEAFSKLPPPVFESGQGRRAKRLWVFAPGESAPARAVAGEARERAQAIATRAGLSKIPLTLNPPVFFSHVEEVDINRSTSYTVRRYDRRSLLVLLDQNLKDLRDPHVKWPARPDPAQAIPALERLRVRIEDNEFGEVVVTRHPATDLRVLVHIYTERRPRRQSFNTGLFMEGHEGLPRVQLPLDPQRARRTRRDKRTDPPLFTLTTPAGEVAFYRANTPAQGGRLP